MASKIKADQFETLDGNGNITLNNSVTMASTKTLPAASLTGALPAISAASLTNIPAANITGTLPAISGANLTGLSTFDPDGAVVINDSGADVDFRVETDTNANALVVNGGANKIGMGMDVDSNDANLTIYTAGDTSTTSDKITFKSAFGNGGKHSIAWKDATNILGRISLEYESASPAQCDITFNSLFGYGGGNYQADTVEVLRIKGSGKGLSSFTCRGWIYFSSGTTIHDSHNVSSIDDNGTGTYAVHWDTDLPSGTYSAPTSTTPYNNSGGYGGIYSRSAATANMNFRNHNGNDQDCTQINCAAFDN